MGTAKISSCGSQESLSVHSKISSTTSLHSKEPGKFHRVISLIMHCVGEQPTEELATQFLSTWSPLFLSPQGDIDFNGKDFLQAFYQEKLNQYTYDKLFME